MQNATKAAISSISDQLLWSVIRVKKRVHNIRVLPISCLIRFTSSRSLPSMLTVPSVGERRVCVCVCVRVCERERYTQIEKK
jgi:hypothetical protein